METKFRVKGFLGQLLHVNEMVLVAEQLKDLVPGSEEYAIRKLKVSIETRVLCL